MSSLSVQLTPEQVASIQRDVIVSVTAQLRRDVMASFNIRQLAGEVKNGVIRELAGKLAADLKNTHKLDEAITRAVQSAEARVTTEIHKRLTSGITVRLGNLPENKQ